MKLKYYLFYSVVTPSKLGTCEKISDRMLCFYFDEGVNVSKKLKKFQEEEKNVCDQFGRKFVMGKVMHHYQGKLTEVDL